MRGEPTMEYEGKLMQFIAKTVFRFADGVILQTEQAGQFFPKVVRRKSVILPNPLNPSVCEIEHKNFGFVRGKA